MSDNTITQERAGTEEAEASACCSTTELSTCCEPEAKSSCCGSVSDDAQSAPSTCGCQ